MANNRMFLVNTRTGAKVQIAKYYPSTGWYPSKGVEGLMDAAFYEADWGGLTEAEAAIKAAQIGFGPPYAAGGMYGAEWKIELEEDGA